MSKETKNNIFNSELKGFKKKQVIEYISGLENAHREKVEAYESEKAKMQAEIDSLNSQYAELLEKYSELQAEKAKVASVLINAENTAAEIVDAARKEGEAEKQRLYDESEDLRRTIVKRNSVIRDVKDRAENIFNSLLDDVHDAVSALEEYIAQGRAQFADDVENIDSYVSEYEKKPDNIGNEFDIDDEEEPEIPEECEEPEKADHVFSDLQSLDDGVDDAVAEESFKEMGLDGKETVRFFGDTEG
jgi:cell division initiation protein